MVEPVPGVHWWVCGGVVSPQRPSYFLKTRQWHPLLCDRASWWCFHPLGEDIQCTGPLAENCQGQGALHWGDKELEHPRLWVIGKEPWGQALWQLLQLRSHVASGSTASEHQEEVPFTQGDCRSSVRTSLSVNDVNGSIDSLSSFTHASSLYGWLAWGSWAFSAQNCKALV